MTQLDYEKKILELAKKMVKNCANESEEAKKIEEKVVDEKGKEKNEFYYLSKKSVEQCLARPDLFDIDYDNLED